MITLGDPSWRTTAGQYGELRVIASGEAVLSITGQALSKFTLKDSSCGVTFLECTIEVDEDPLDGLRHIQLGTVLEMRAASADSTLTLLGTARVDYVKHIRDGKHQKVYLQARSPAATLLDEGEERAFHGLLPQLLREVCAAHEVAGRVILPDMSIDAWIDADSAYGALRLIGASLDFIVESQRDGGIRILSRSDRLREALSETPITIDSDSILKAGYVQGVPIVDPGVDV